MGLIDVFPTTDVGTDPGAITSFVQAAEDLGVADLTRPRAVKTTRAALEIPDAYIVTIRNLEAAMRD